MNDFILYMSIFISICLTLTFMPIVWVKLLHSLKYDKKMRLPYFLIYLFLLGTFFAMGMMYFDVAGFLTIVVGGLTIFIGSCYWDFNGTLR